jgi:hypothetical protein
LGEEIDMSDERPPERESLKEIVYRHGGDRWKDAGFIAAVVILMAFAIGATTSKAVGKPMQFHDHVVIIQGPAELAQ